MPYVAGEILRERLNREGRLSLCSGHDGAAGHRRLRITVQLVDAAEDEPVWSERFSGTMDEVFEVQERVAREIEGDTIPLPLLEAT